MLYFSVCLSTLANLHIKIKTYFQRSRSTFPWASVYRRWTRWCLRSPPSLEHSSHLCICVLACTRAYSKSTHDCRHLRCKGRPCIPFGSLRKNRRISFPSSCSVCSSRRTRPLRNHLSVFSLWIYTWICIFHSVWCTFASVHSLENLDERVIF